MDGIELKNLYIDWIEDETNNKFDRDKLPAGVILANNLLTELDPLDFDVVSESIADLRQTFATNEEGIPLKIMRWLKPYYRLKSL